MRGPHIVPLSRQLAELQRELSTHTGSVGCFFPKPSQAERKHDRHNAEPKLELIGFNGKDSIGFSANAFRATATTMQSEMGNRADVIKRQLTHAERNKVRTSYNQAEYMEERR